MTVSNEMKAYKLKLVAQMRDVTVDALINKYVTESIVPGICTCTGCDYTIDVEPDQRIGWCEICDEDSVVLILVLAGII